MEGMPTHVPVPDKKLISSTPFNDYKIKHFESDKQCLVILTNKMFLVIACIGLIINSMSFTGDIFYLTEKPSAVIRLGIF